MLYKDNENGPLYAVSYDSVTFADLKFFLNATHNVKLERIDPDVFLSSVPDPLINYINLATKFPLRKKVTDHFTYYNATRFSYSVDNMITVDLQKSKGSFLYPNVCIYPGATIGQDTMIHSGSLIAHGCNIGAGCFISAGVVICGGAIIDNNCWIGAQTTVIDQINVASNTTIAAASIIHKDIVESNMLYLNGKLSKI